MASRSTNGITDRCCPSHVRALPELTRRCVSALISFTGGLGEQSLLSSENATSADRSNNAVIKGNVVPHPDLWVSFIYFFIPL